MIQKFTERFEIETGVDEARRRFVNRAYNRVFLDFFLSLHENTRFRVQKEIASALGDKFQFNQPLEELKGDDYLRNLLALETLYQSVPENDRFKVGNLILQLLKESEIDLGIRFEKGAFIKSGAELLDNNLVNDPLRWLRKNNYASVLVPYEKGLKLFLESENRPEILPDIITDMYESLEALAKIVTGRPEKDLSANREVFIKKVNASNRYKELLGTYVSYANEFRHACQKDTAKPNLSVAEVESFVYLTGIFIRLSI